MIVAYLQWCLILSAFVYAIKNRFYPGASIKPWWILPAILILAALPLGKLPVYGYLWGVFGQLSITSTLLVARHVGAYASDSGLHRLRFNRAWLYVPIAIPALVFYPLALGASPVDPYNWGFQPLVLTVSCLLLAAILWLRKQRVLAWMIPAAVACHQLGLLESDNLWDYLFDPYLVFYSWGWGVRRLLEYFKMRTRTQTG